MAHALSKHARIIVYTYGKGGQESCIKQIIWQKGLNKAVLKWYLVWDRGSQGIVHMYSCL